MTRKIYKSQDFIIKEIKEQIKDYKYFKTCNKYIAFVYDDKIILNDFKQKQFEIKQTVQDLFLISNEQDILLYYQQEGFIKENLVDFDSLSLKLSKSYSKKEYLENKKNNYFLKNKKINKNENEIQKLQFEDNQQKNKFDLEIDCQFNIKISMNEDQIGNYKLGQKFEKVLKYKETILQLFYNNKYLILKNPDMLIIIKINQNYINYEQDLSIYPFIENYKVIEIQQKYDYFIYDNKQDEQILKNQEILMICEVKENENMQISIFPITSLFSSSEEIDESIINIHDKSRIENEEEKQQSKLEIPKQQSKQNLNKRSSVQELEQLHKDLSSQQNILSQIPQTPQKQFNINDFIQGFGEKFYNLQTEHKEKFKETIENVNKKHLINQIESFLSKSFEQNILSLQEIYLKYQKKAETLEKIQQNISTNFYQIFNDNKQNQNILIKKLVKLDNNTKKDLIDQQKKQDEQLVIVEEQVKEVRKVQKNQILSVKELLSQQDNIILKLKKLIQFNL